MDVENYLSIKRMTTSSSPAEAKAYEVTLNSYLQGIADGANADGAVIRYQNQNIKDFRPLCVPGNLMFDSELVKKHVDAYIAKNKSALDLSANIGLIFVSQLAKTYPCGD
ncbi:Rap1a/Tai family immunity protein [Serratia marcescens]|uniref:Rap1a/Tai family immunity protein n=1 Tax=Serratia marcescens TaxID=615 RepID=UPI003FA6E00B